MKTIIQSFLMLMLFYTFGHSAGIVSRSVARDTLAIPFVVLDSIGNAVDLSFGDSVYCSVFSPGGTVVFKDSMAYNDPSIVSYDWQDFSGGQHYAYVERVSVLDGTSTADGVFSYILSIDDNTGADLITTYTGQFQIINSTLESALDSAGLSAVNSNKTLDSLGIIIDSLYAVLDSVQNGSTANDSNSISRWVWNTPQTNHQLAGSFGKYLDTEISGVSSGSGNFSYSVVTFDSTNLQPLSGVSLTIRNIAQTALIAVGSSDNNGLASFNLNADSFVVVANAPGYLFTPFDSIVVTGTGVDSVFGYPFSPGTPSPGLCRVFGFLLNISGKGEVNASVSAHLPKGVSRSGSSIVSPFRVTTVTDTTGFWAIDVVPSTLLNPVTSKYEFLITRIDGTILRKRVTVPNQSSWQLTW